MLTRRISSPCMGCEDREPGCHGACEEYLAYKDHVAALNRAVYEQKGSAAQEYSYEKDTMIRRKKNRKQ